ncbi:acylneuraminate cytidylyltransferase family protein [Candidatus Pelagibacter sp.]|nr:acylneuraminate cytidylyltransferase family protein [Candidatus Pelagibacter sp.]
MKKIKNYLAVIPCRKGSKRIRNKNTKKFRGKELYKLTIEQSLRLFVKKNVIISTDDEKIIKFCKSKKINFIKRSKSLSKGEITNMQVLNNVILKIKTDIENLIYLQVTSPLRRDKDIKNATELFNKKACNCLISVNDAFTNPLWCNSIKNNSMYNFIGKKISLTQSQKLPKKYQINGAIFITKKRFVKDSNSFFQIKNSIPFYMNKRYSIDIDDLEDFKIAEKLYVK